MEIDIGTFNPLAFLFLAAPLFFLWRRGRSLGYIFYFSLFFFYMWAVFANVIFPLPLDGSYFDTIRGRTWASQVNFAPLFLAREFDVRSVQIYGNFLLGVPFGFGVLFVSSVPSRRVIPLGLGFALGLELLQLIIGLIYGFPYRVIDVNDVLLVFAGVVLGYLALRATAHGYRRLTGAGAATGPLGRHVHSVLFRVLDARALM
jgi:glycopeptide antibiotics resistance protein